MVLQHYNATNLYNRDVVVMIVWLLDLQLPVQRCEFEPFSWWGVPDTTLCDKVCQWLVAGRLFSPGTLVSSTNKPDHQDIAEILLKVALNTIYQSTK
jgi:hypothetical protein